MNFKSLSTSLCSRTVDGFNEPSTTFALTEITDHFHDPLLPKTNSKLPTQKFDVILGDHHQSCFDEPTAINEVIKICDRQSTQHLLRKLKLNFKIIDANQISFH